MFFVDKVKKKSEAFFISNRNIYLCGVFIRPNTVGELDIYKLPLKSLSEGTHSFEYELDDNYFKEIDSLDVQTGNVKAKVQLRKTAEVNELTFQLDGTVFIPCDRCLDKMEQEITYEGKLIVKFGDDLLQESDEIVIVSDDETEINIAWFLFEFIALSIPVKHVHPLGECNELMTAKLKEHLIYKVSDEEEEDFDDKTEEIEKKIDPRWDNLKKLIDN